jgi:hypothetical protein
MPDAAYYSRSRVCCQSRRAPAARSQRGPDLCQKDFAQTASLHAAPSALCRRPCPSTLTLHQQWRKRIPLSQTQRVPTSARAEVGTGRPRLPRLSRGHGGSGRFFVDSSRHRCGARPSRQGLQCGKTPHSPLLRSGGQAQSSPLARATAPSHRALGFTVRVWVSLSTAIKPKVGR